MGGEGGREGERERGREGERERGGGGGRGRNDYLRHQGLQLSHENPVISLNLAQSSGGLAVPVWAPHI